MLRFTAVSLEGIIRSRLFEKLIEKFAAMLRTGYVRAKFRYNVLLSGGGINTCSADEDVIETLHDNSPIVIETTAILGKCKATPPSWPIDADKLIRIAVR